MISNQSRKRAPNLATPDRFVPGLTILLLNPSRIPKLAALVEPATLLRFRQALVIRSTAWQAVEIRLNIPAHFVRAMVSIVFMFMPKD